MFAANFKFRVLLFGLVSAGIVLPAWATQPCRCGVEKDCCSGKSACCEQKPCCAEKSIHQHAAVATCLVCCSCCSEASAPTSPAPQQTQHEHSTPAQVADVSPVIPPIASIAYLVRELGSPSGHPALRLHALFGVWLN